MPNEYSPEFGDNEALGKSIIVYDHVNNTRRQIGKAGMSWTSLTSSYWYEFSLAGSPSRYGFDFGKKELTTFDDGNVKINTSTWDQSGRAVAKLLSLKILPEDESDQSPTLSLWWNRALHISSFLLSQRDMLASVLRVTGENESDWTIKSQPAEERFKHAVDLIQSGDRSGFELAMYTRCFFKDGVGNYEKDGKLDNDILGLPMEDLDEATAFAVRMAETGEASYHTSKD
jgi:hypothetical protein